VDITATRRITAPGRRTAGRGTDPGAAPALQMPMPMPAMVPVPNLIRPDPARATAALDTAVIRRHPVTVKSAGRKSEIALDTDRPQEFIAAIRDLKARGGANESNDGAINDAITKLKALGADQPNSPLTGLLNSCTDIYVGSHTDATAAETPPKKAKRKAASFEKMGPEDWAAKAEAWQLDPQSPLINAARAAKPSYTFMNGLSPANRKLVTVDTVRQPPAFTGSELTYYLQLKAGVPAKPHALRTSWSQAGQHLSDDLGKRYLGRMEKALAGADDFAYFAGLGADERMYGSAAKFMSRKPQDPQAVAKAKEADHQQLKAVAKAQRTGQRAADSVAEAEATRQRAEINLTVWPAHREELLARAGQEVQAARVDDGGWQTTVEPILATAVADLATGHDLPGVQAAARTAVVRALKEQYFNQLARAYPNLTQDRKAGVRAAVMDDPLLTVTDVDPALRAAWNEQRSLPTPAAWADALGLVLQEGDRMENFNPLPPVGQRGAHFSVRAEGITAATVQAGTTAQDLIEQLFGAYTPRHLQVHVTLETAVRFRRGPRQGEYQLPHRYWNGTYAFSYREPVEPVPGQRQGTAPHETVHNRWDGNVYVPGTPAETQIRADLDQAHQNMLADLHNRATRFLTDGR
jgi:hypothetical protein